MVTQDRRSGCGCCGCLFSLIFFLGILILIAVGFFYFYASNNLTKLAAPGPAPLSSTTFNRQTYANARQKLDHFFADAAERSVTLSNAEVNALLAESPQLRILRRGTIVVLNQNSAQVYCSLRVDLPFLSRRYLNYAFHARPSMRGDEIELNVSQIERDGKPLEAAEQHQLQFAALPLIEKTLSALNKIQMDRAVRDVRIENGNLILAR
jgi:hypothetical protein